MKLGVKKEVKILTNRKNDEKGEGGAGGFVEK